MIVLLIEESQALASKCQELESQHTELLAVLDAKDSAIQNYAVQLQAKAEDPSVSTLTQGKHVALKQRTEDLSRDLQLDIKPFRELHAKAKDSGVFK